jgi:branched-chain amino acid transport system permease protein
VDYVYFVLTIVCIWVIASLAANLVVGYTGLMAIGHVGYIAIGAYTVAVLNIFGHVPYFAAVPIAVLATAAVACVTILPLLRLSAFYFGLGTLGLNVVIVELLSNLAPRSEGAEGLFGMHLPPLMAGGGGRLAVSLVLTALCAFVAWRIVSSPFGRTLRAVRDQPEALASVGKDPNSYRVLIWTISGGVAGLAGALYAATLSYIDPTVFAVLFSFNLLVYIGVGGLASILGSIVGPLLLIGFGEALRFGGLPSEISGPAQQALFALLLILVMLFRRQGLVGRYDFRE